MTLYIRMGLYFIFAALASQGIVVFDQTDGTVAFQVEDLALVLGGVVAYAVTYVTSRIAKSRGGKT